MRETHRSIGRTRLESIRYTPAVGRKFHTDGSVRRFPGNTVICFGTPDCAAYQHGKWIQAQLGALPFAHKFTMLPPSSFHMTVFQLLCDEEREPQFWSSQLPLDMPLAETDAFFLKKVPAVEAPANFRMTFMDLGIGHTAMGMRLKPADDETHHAVWDYRERLATATGVRFPDHDEYVFHISLCYIAQEMTDAEAAQLADVQEQVNAKLTQEFGVFESGQPTLTFFDDMFAFVPAEERHTLASRQ